MQNSAYRSIFARSTAGQRAENFVSYFAFSQARSGELLEAEQDLSIKRAHLAALQEAPVRSRRPLRDVAAFYRNYVTLKDKPESLDRKTLLFTCIYKFARHEWVGITGAWKASPSLAHAKNLTDKISRYHLAEEFCHIRLFHEMFRTMQLDEVVWEPLGPAMQAIYQLFPYFPGFFMDPPAFVTELMGIVFYRHIDRLLDDILDDEPEARGRIRVLLHEIMIDELAHVGQRRNFMGPIGIRIARLMVGPLFRAFFREIPESALLLDVDAMVRDGLAFDYSLVPAEMVDQSWVPSYCCEAAGVDPIGASA